MKKNVIYISLLILSIIMFIVAVAFNINDIIAFILCIVSIYLFVGSLIKLCKESKKFKSVVENFIDLLFWLP